jgi:4-amino-4-deoxy-L-arabinose transferase-like glycosyltransferase
VLKKLLWIICLAFLSVGARNFEEGLSLDAPLYTTISREIARSGELFKLDSRVTEFQPYYADHPHLAFWIQAGLYKIFGASDWSSRISGHLFYILSLFLVFLWARKRLGESAATLAVLLLWIWAHFANFFSSFYLDPPAFFFGLFFLYALHESLLEKSFKWAALSGISLGLCFAAKGLTLLGFGPAAALLVLLYWRSWPQAAICLFATASTVGAYWLSIKLSNAPDFLDLYWYRQMTNRFAGSLKLVRLLESRFWWALLKDSYFLLPLVLLSLRKKYLREPLILVSWTLLLTFIFMYAPAERIGGQYWMYLLPWMAILMAASLGDKIIWRFEKWQSATAFIGIAGMFLLQYGSLRTHRLSKPREAEMLQKWSTQLGVRSVYLAQSPLAADFMNSAPLTWYADIDVEYANAAIPEAPKERALLLYRDLEKDLSSEASKSFEAHGWCVVEKQSNALLLANSCLF